MMIRNLLVFAFIVMGIGWQPLSCLATDEAAPSAPDSAPSSAESQASAPIGTGQDNGPSPAVAEGSSKAAVLLPKKHEAVRELHDVRAAATILAHDAIRSDFDPLGVIAGTPSGKSLLTIGDMVLIRFERSAQPKPHDIFVVVRPTHAVQHPRSHHSMGQLVKVVGVVELDQAAGDSWSGRIIQSPDFMSVGDAVVNLESEEGAPTDPVTSDAGSGYVVAVSDEQVLLGAFQTIYTDLGHNHGVRPGQVFTIVREGSGGSQGSLSRTIGEAKVVSVQSASSSVLVTKSAEPIEIGDRIEARPQSTSR